MVFWVLCGEKRFPRFHVFSAPSSVISLPRHCMLFNVGFNILRKMLWEEVLMAAMIHLISSWYEWLYWEDGFNNRYMLLMLSVKIYIYVFMVLSSVCSIARNILYSMWATCKGRLGVGVGV